MLLEGNRPSRGERGDAEGFRSGSKIWSVSVSEKQARSRGKLEAESSFVGYHLVAWERKRQWCADDLQAGQARALGTEAEPRALTE